MKPFKIKENVESTAKIVNEVEVDIDTTFVNRGISKLYDEDNNHIGYNIAIQEWWKNKDYIAKISKDNSDLKLKNKILEEELFLNKEAIFELVMEVYD